MDDIFANIVPQIDDAISEVRALAVEASAPETTYEPILAGVKKRAGLIERIRVYRLIHLMPEVAL